MSALLLSAILGGLFGSVVTFIGQAWLARVRHKADIALEFIQWCDEVWLAVGVMESTKGHTFEGQPEAQRQMALSRYTEARNTALPDLLRNAPTAKIAIGWGTNSVEYRMAKSLQDQALEGARLLTRAKKETWEADSQAADQLLTDADTVRLELYDRLVRAGSVPVLLSGYRKWIPARRSSRPERLQ